MTVLETEWHLVMWTGERYSVTAPKHGSIYMPDSSAFSILMRDSEGTSPKNVRSQTRLGCPLDNDTAPCHLILPFLKEPPGCFEHKWRRSTVISCTTTLGLQWWHETSCFAQDFQRLFPMEILLVCMVNHIRLSRVGFHWLHFKPGLLNPSPSFYVLHNTGYIPLLIFNSLTFFKFVYP